MRVLGASFQLVSLLATITASSELGVTNLFNSHRYVYSLDILSSQDCLGFHKIEWLSSYDKPAGMVAQPNYLKVLQAETDSVSNPPSPLTPAYEVSIEGSKLKHQVPPTNLYLNGIYRNGRWNYLTNDQISELSLVDGDVLVGFFGVDKEIEGLKSLVADHIFTKSSEYFYLVEPLLPRNAVRCFIAHFGAIKALSRMEYLVPRYLVRSKWFYQPFKDQTMHKWALEEDPSLHSQSRFEILNLMDTEDKRFSLMAYTPYFGAILTSTEIKISDHSSICQGKPDGICIQDKDEAWISLEIKGDRLQISRKPSAPYSTLIAYKKTREFNAKKPVLLGNLNETIKIKNDDLLFICSDHSTNPTGLRGSFDFEQPLSEFNHKRLSPEEFAAGFISGSLVVALKLIVIAPQQDNSTDSFELPMLIEDFEEKLSITTFPSKGSTIIQSTPSNAVKAKNKTSKDLEPKPVKLAKNGNNKSNVLLKGAGMKLNNQRTLSGKSQPKLSSALSMRKDFINQAQSLNTKLKKTDYKHCDKLNPLLSGSTKSLVSSFTTLFEQSCSFVADVMGGMETYLSEFEKTNSLTTVSNEMALSTTELEKTTQLTTEPTNGKSKINEEMIVETIPIVEEDIFTETRIYELPLFPTIDKPMIFQAVFASSTPNYPTGMVISPEYLFIGQSIQGKLVTFPSYSTNAKISKLVEKNPDDWGLWLKYFPEEDRWRLRRTSNLKNAHFAIIRERQRHICDFNSDKEVWDLELKPQDVIEFSPGISSHLPKDKSFTDHVRIMSSQNNTEYPIKSLLLLINHPDLTVKRPKRPDRLVYKSLMYQNWFWYRNKDLIPTVERSVKHPLPLRRFTFQWTIQDCQKFRLTSHFYGFGISIDKRSLVISDNLKLRNPHLVSESIASHALELKAGDDYVELNITGTPPFTVYHRRDMEFERFYRLEGKYQLQVLNNDLIAIVPISQHALYPEAKWDFELPNQLTDLQDRIKGGFFNGGWIVAKIVELKGEIGKFGLIENYLLLMSKYVVKNQSSQDGKDAE